jgi:Na+-translocating ferredoxin:NAD+ oxidoreductase RnfE subunit
MFFINTPLRRTQVAPSNLTPSLNKPRLSQSLMIIVYLCVIVGVVLVVIGLISQIHPSLYTILGVSILIVAGCLTLVALFHTKLDAMYKQMIYQSNISVQPACPVALDRVAIHQHPKKQTTDNR